MVFRFLRIRAREGGNDDRATMALQVWLYKIIARRISERAGN
jgi:hypothetical protein